jgi:hypothetical protein
MVGLLFVIFSSEVLTIVAYISFIETEHSYSIFCVTSDNQRNTRSLEDIGP